MPENDWDRHWDHYAESATANPAQELRRRIVHSLLALDDRPARVLDIGCGQGDLIATLRATHPQAELCGIDYSKAGIQVGRTKVPEATFLQRDLSQAAQPPEHLRRWATHAVCSEVLEHVDDPRAFLQNAAEYLATGCLLVVTVPGGPMSAFDYHIGHRKHFSIDMLRQLLIDCGFRPLNVAGAGLPFFNLYRMAIIMRGPKLVADVAQPEVRRMSGMARAAMQAFRRLFLLNLPPNRWGWQIVGAARLERC